MGSAIYMAHVYVGCQDMVNWYMERTKSINLLSYNSKVYWIYINNRVKVVRYATGSLDAGLVF